MSVKLALPLLLVLADKPADSITTGDSSTMTNTYDSLSRLSAQTRPMSRITYSYLAGANGTTTGLVSAVTHSKVGSNSFSPITFGYAYDELGYITSYTQTGKQDVTYDYDQQGQLTSVSDPNQDLYYSYEYDTYGNIRSAEAHGSYHTSDDYSNSYSYGNSKWLDLLTGFNDELIIYEGQSIVNGEIVGDPTSGNPISYFNGTRWEFVWENGRQLASASTTDGDTTIAIDYTYDINGLRTSKTITRTTGGGTAHTHEYTSAVTAPTCTTAGYTTYTCDCGESYVDSLVDALGHNYVQSGNVYTCSRCGDSYTGHEHSYTEETTEPTCTTAGYTVYTCSCGDSYTVDIPALGHNYVLVNQNGTVGTYRCSRCGHTYSAIIPVTPPSTEYSLRSATVTTEYHEYIYASGKLLREVITTTDEDGNVTTEILDFTYDASGSPYTVTRIVGTSSSTYYYVVNPQGDVIRLVSANGATVAEYAYDPWGRVISATGTMAEVNPLRYRGYYYDAETEFYYLQSRYYDPVICRFINADGLTSTGQSFLGYNMFAYCRNNPVIRVDIAGLVDNVAVNPDSEKDWETLKIIYESATGDELIIPDQSRMFEDADYVYITITVEEDVGHDKTSVVSDEVSDAAYWVGVVSTVVGVVATLAGWDIVGTIATAASVPSTTVGIIEHNTKDEIDDCDFGFRKYTVEYTYAWRVPTKDCSDGWGYGNFYSATQVYYYGSKGRLFDGNTKEYLGHTDKLY